MELQQQRSFDATRRKSALAQRLLASEAGAQPHVEDAFLADFACFVRDTDAAGPPWFAIEVGRAALDLIEDIEGSWQSLPIEIWLDALTRALAAIGAEQVRSLARVFVEWLVMRARLSLHGQRALARRIAAWRVAH